MQTWIGTSGFQYPEWKGLFYPEKMSAAKMLPYYAERFTGTEINYTFRRIPSAKAMAGWCAATPAGFRFAFKAPQRVTHLAKLRGCGETLTVFSAALRVAGEKQGPVLFQLPLTFRKDVEALRAFLGEVPVGMRCAFEFRHASWFADEVFEVLRGGNVALCVAESAELATPAVVTADFGYLRLRREDYTLGQIRKWGKWMMEQGARWTDAYVFFKHEARAVGPKFAGQMMKVVAGSG
jgi:uncharacterized protein YecE (DUF72 family)